MGRKTLAESSNLKTFPGLPRKHAREMAAVMVKHAEDRSIIETILTLGPDQWIEFPYPDRIKAKPNHKARDYYRQMIATRVGRYLREKGYITPSFSKKTQEITQGTGFQVWNQNYGD